VSALVVEAPDSEAVTKREIDEPESIDDTPVEAQAETPRDNGPTEDDQPTGSSPPASPTVGEIVKKAMQDTDSQKRRGRLQRLRDRFR
jgi:hypothetical protein